MSGLTTDPTDPRLGHGVDQEPTSQHEVYLVLSEEERAKGFVRPVRRTYIHTGERPKYPLRDLAPEEQKRYAAAGYVKYEAYPPDSPEFCGGRTVGRFWTEAQLNTGCGTATTMGQALAETYARNPKFYGSTYCCHCQKHLPVAEFTWEDGSVVGS